MEIWTFFNGMEWWMTSLFLALFGLGLSIPLRVTMVSFARFRLLKPVFFFVINPVLEEIILRLVVLTYLLWYFDPVTAILITTVLYMIYGFAFYGTGFIPDALVLGLIFSFAFLEFGFIVVLLAHILYRLIDLVR